MSHDKITRLLLISGLMIVRVAGAEKRECYTLSGRRDMADRRKAANSTKEQKLDHLLDLTAQIIASHATGTSIRSNDLPALIGRVFDSLKSLNLDEAAEAGASKPSAGRARSRSATPKLPVTPARRGRKPAAATARHGALSSPSLAPVSRRSPSAPAAGADTAPKRRGRPKAAQLNGTGAPAAAPAEGPRKRGRPAANAAAAPSLAKRTRARRQAQQTAAMAEAGSPEVKKTRRPRVAKTGNGSTGATSEKASRRGRKPSSAPDSSAPRARKSRTAKAAAVESPAEVAGSRPAPELAAQPVKRGRRKVVDAAKAVDVAKPEQAG